MTEKLPQSRESPSVEGSLHVPVSMCSPRSASVDVAGFLVSEVWFPPDTNIPRHTHERAVLGVMLGGGFEDRFSKQTLAPLAGAVFTEPGEEAHSNHVGSRGAHVLALQPDPADTELSATCRELLDDVRSFPHAGVTDSARRLSREIRSPDAYSCLAIESLALDMLVGATRFKPASNQPDWLCIVDELIRDSFRERLNIAEIASTVGVHRAHLARVYKRHRGLPLGTHIRHLRLDWAAARLTETLDSISSVALRAGFSDQSHLTRHFKQRFGVPPGVFRVARSVRR